MGSYAAYRINQLESNMEHQNKRMEALELVASCAKDVMEYWPQFSFRTVKTMVAKMENLKQALEMLK